MTKKYLQIFDDGRGELFGGGVAPQVLGLHLPLGEDLVHALPDLARVEAEAGVIQQVCRAQQHCSCAQQHIRTVWGQNEEF